MTYEQRERIFSKEYISIGEFMELTGVLKTDKTVEELFSNEMAL